MNPQQFQVIDSKLDSILGKLDEQPDKRDLGRVKRQILKAIEGADEREEQKKGPSTKVRLEQVSKVKTILFAAIEDGRSLSLNDACLEAWEPLTGGYPTPKSLYQYCHEHKYEFPIAD